MDLKDATLDELRAALAPQVAANAAFDGWTVRAVDAAADALGVDHDVARLAFTDGPVAMIDAWFAHIDAAMLARFAPEQLAAMKIRARITALVEARLELAAPHREALRRALAILAMPQNAARAARLGWRAADAMWRAAGDTATDYNHYSKRMTLGAVYAATIAVFLDDESEGHADTRAFLARRIENIMQFERAKAKWLTPPEHRFSLSRFIGRLRYPAV
ncbi:COQ9 family protein [Sphingomonas sp. HITSZ_GF]|uniref:COQ9 family protein n=1 Tax=Sphingomonas sp. HITSZ_GF TaxID=3037247 RepID=UPI00240E4150|nr:COQ9 family protein [Sphingomonas sp. HITSZ_GF]MDG2533697.1 COQ9 family protein [Sphingomonas sp. HITSZ_GF]